MFTIFVCYGFTLGKLRKLGNNFVSVISDPYTVVFFVDNFGGGLS